MAAVADKVDEIDKMAIMDSENNSNSAYWQLQACVIITAVIKS